MAIPEDTDEPEIRPGRALRVAVLVKQVPLAENLELGPDGRLRRGGIELEMNPYCRRAVSMGAKLRTLSGGTCAVFTLGPPSAEDVLREAVAWGADRGLHLCDPAFAGSDTLATARALAAGLRREGPFDLVLVGRNTTDGDTGQVGPEVAELLDLPFATGVRHLALDADVLTLGLELDDGSEEVEVHLPAVLSVAERLCEPAKVGPEGRRAVPDDLIVRLTSTDLGDGPWGEAGSPTKVGEVRVMPHERACVVLSGDLDAQVAEAVQILDERGALTPSGPHLDGEAHSGGAHSHLDGEAHSGGAVLAAAAGGHVRGPVSADGSARPIVAVVLEDGRPTVVAELLGAARRLADEIGGEVVAWQCARSDARDAPSGASTGLGALGADAVVELVRAGPPARGDEGSAEALGAEDVAASLIEWSRSQRPWALLLPSTSFGREVGGRTAAALGGGLVGDAIGLEVVSGELVAAKPAFAGALVADITSTSPVRLVTVRPGVLALPARRVHEARWSRRDVHPRGRVRSLSQRREDDVEVLARAEVVIGVGTGVAPDEYELLTTLAAILGAELAATRKVTDRGWAPRARQVGITGRSIAPRLYIAIGLSGKFNHVVGVRSAGTILAVNADPAAPIFAHADVGIVADWHDVLPRLEAELRSAGARPASPAPHERLGIDQVAAR